MANETQVIKENFLIFNNAFEGLYSKLVIAILILLIGFIVGRIIGRIITKSLAELALDDIVRNKLRIQASMSEFIGSLVSYIIYFISIIITLGQLGVQALAVQVLSIFVILLIFVSTAFAIKDFFPNMFAGIFIHNKKYFRKGDKIKFKNIKGTVVDAGLIETKIITPRGDVVMVPNSAFSRDEVVKISEGSKTRKSGKHLKQGNKI